MCFWQSHLCCYLRRHVLELSTHILGYCLPALSTFRPYFQAVLGSSAAHSGVQLLQLCLLHFQQMNKPLAGEARREESMGDDVSESKDEDEDEDYRPAKRQTLLSHLQSQSRPTSIVLDPKSDDLDSSKISDKLTPVSGNYCYYSRSSRGRGVSAPVEITPTEEFQQWPFQGFLKRVCIGDEIIYNLECTLLDQLQLLFHSAMLKTSSKADLSENSKPGLS